MRAAPSVGQAAVDDATPDAWHQPSEDEILEQQRKAHDARVVDKDHTSAL
jgi:hypothetical protein